MESKELTQLNTTFFLCYFLVIKKMLVRVRVCFCV